jgi:hypothetical protein
VYTTVRLGLYQFINVHQDLIIPQNDGNILIFTFVNLHIIYSSSQNVDLKYILVLICTHHLSHSSMENLNSLSSLVGGKDITDIIMEYYPTLLARTQLGAFSPKLYPMRPKRNSDTPTRTLLLRIGDELHVTSREVGMNYIGMDNCWIINESSVQHGWFYDDICDDLDEEREQKIADDIYFKCQKLVPKTWW